MKSIAIVGAGAVGLYYGARLALAGEDVRFLLRSDFEAVTERGIIVESVDGDAVAYPVKAFRDAEEIGPVDLVIVAWKATSNDLLDEVLPPLLHEGTQVLTLQNGLGNCERIAAIVRPERVLGGLCFVCINRIGNGHVSHTAGGKVTVGEWRPQPGLPRAAEVVGKFEKAGVPSRTAADVEGAIWRKLVWNIPFNGLAIAEGGVTTDALLASSEIEAEIRALMEETVAAAGALGHGIDPEVIDFEISRTRPMGPYKPSSMIDFVEGREVEYDSIWGEPLRRAQAAGLKVPRIESLAARIRERLGR